MIATIALAIVAVQVASRAAVDRMAPGLSAAAETLVETLAVAAVLAVAAWRLLTAVARTTSGAAVVPLPVESPAAQVRHLRLVPAPVRSRG